MFFSNLEMVSFLAVVGVRGGVNQEEIFREKKNTFLVLLKARRRSAHPENVADSSWRVDLPSRRAVNISGRPRGKERREVPT